MHSSVVPPIITNAPSAHRLSLQRPSHALAHRCPSISPHAFVQSSPTPPGTHPGPTFCLPFRPPAPSLEHIGLLARWRSRAPPPARPSCALASSPSSRPAKPDSSPPPPFCARYGYCVALGPWTCASLRVARLPPSPPSAATRLFAHAKNVPVPRGPSQCARPLTPFAGPRAWPSSSSAPTTPPLWPWRWPRFVLRPSHRLCFSLSFAPAMFLTCPASPECVGLSIAHA